MLPGSELNGMPSYDQLVSHRLLEPTSLCPYDDLHRKLRCALWCRSIRGRYFGIVAVLAPPPAKSILTSYRSSGQSKIH